MKICPKCNCENKDSFQFCKNCGFKLKQNEKKTENIKSKCPNCGGEINKKEDFCKNCGFKLNPNEKKTENKKNNKNTENAKNTQSTKKTKINKNTKNTENAKNVCSKCGHKVSEGATFCNNCGSKIQKEKNESDYVFCINCGAKLDYETRFCPNCGISPTGKSSIDDIKNKPKPKESRLLAAIFSLFIPGLGQIFIGLTKRGISIFILLTICFILAAIGIGAILVIIIWFYSIYDAWKSASTMNQNFTVEDTIILTGLLKKL